MRNARLGLVVVGKLFDLELACESSISHFHVEKDFSHEKVSYPSFHKTQQVPSREPRQSFEFPGVATLMPAEQR